MADDWDLYAVVRSCTTTNKNNNTTISSIKTDNNNIKNETWPKSTENDENPLACLASLTFEQEIDPFGFSTPPETNNTNNNLFQNPPPSDFGIDLAPYTPSPTVVNSTNPHLDHPLVAGINGGNNNTNSITPPHFNSSNMPVLQVPPSPSQSQPPLPPQFHAQVVPLVPPFHPPMRPRKRKREPKKMVCLVTAENLSSDMWAWRKYGQKSIKGSPYPRNYYRCSSSKGCSAKKQVEGSIVEPTMFTVSYTGEHNHPRPTNRNSLAGSTRSKFNSSIAPKPDSSDVIYFPVQTLSPITPLVTAPAVLSHQDTTANMDFDETSGSQELAAERSGGENNRANNGDDDDDEDNLLIPNRMAMYGENIFLGFHGL